jgi:hypothetical protein
MKLKDIQAGKKYYRAIAGHKRSKITGLRAKSVHTLYVLDVDTLQRRVLASINRLPPEWFEQSRFARWTNTYPETKMQKQNQ